MHHGPSITNNLVGKDMYRWTSMEKGRERIVNPKEHQTGAVGYLKSCL